MPRPKANRRTKTGKPRYTARLYVGGGKYEWCGTYDTPKERDQALEEARKRGPGMPTCDEYADRFLTAYAARNKQSSYDTARQEIKAFRKQFGNRPLNSITPTEAEDWARTVPTSKVPVVVTMFNRAADQWLIDRNPFKGLGQRGKGRSEQPPPTEKEMDQLLTACSALGWYAPRMRALIRFSAFEGTRPGETFQLKWDNVDFAGKRITVAERVYKGRVDTPKNGREKTIALTPPAAQALQSLPRVSEYVFTNKQGGRMSQETLSRYWHLVLAKANLDFDFYLATKHYCAHYLWVKLGLPERVIKEQMGWSVNMLDVYGHGDVGALDEIDAAFSRVPVSLRAVKDASETHSDG